jgi:hypothetical protein
LGRDRREEELRARHRTAKTTEGPIQKPRHGAASTSCNLASEKRRFFAYSLGLRSRA